jgi:hypothetical protein
MADEDPIDPLAVRYCGGRAGLTAFADRLGVLLGKLPAE